jgi:hypothetical protein
MTSATPIRSLLAELPSPPADKQGWPWTEATTCPPDAESKTWPRITLATPSFNQAAYLEETIRSVLLQGYPNLQYLVIDGGSTNGSVDIIRKYAPWLDHWVSEPDRGQSHAIQKGITRANGEWFNWINSDDYLAPGSLFAFAAALETPGAVAVCGMTANLQGRDVFSRYSAKILPDWPGCLFALQVNQPGSLLHLPAVRQAGGVREDLHLVMDLDLWLHLLRRHGPSAFRQIDREVATYRYHESSKTCAGSDVFALEEFALLADLAASIPGLNLTPGIQQLRSRCSAACVTAAGDGPVIPAPAAERAWIERLVVNDSLLFRACRKAQPEESDPLTTFLALLDELIPALERHFEPQACDRIRSAAIIHALQIEGRRLSSAGLQALRLSPTRGTLRDLLRLALR